MTILHESNGNGVGPSSRGRRACRVLVVAGVRIYRDQLAQLLGDAGVVVAGCSERLTTLPEPRDLADVILFDVGAPDAVDQIRALKAVLPDAVVIAFAINDDDDDVVRFAEAGASGYVSRDVRSSAEVVDAVLRAARGEVVCSPRTTASLFRRLATLSPAAAASPSAASLTPREHEVVQLIDQGLSNKEIARRLSISLTTVKNHVHHVIKKLHAKRRGEAAHRIRGNGDRDSRSRV
jgi:two-component system, NarL family, nitrate/nitrite response regulator NarL